MRPGEVAEVLRALARIGAALGTLGAARHDELFSGSTVESMSPEDLMDAASVADAAASSLREEAGRREAEAEIATVRRVRIRHAGHRI